MLLNTDHLARCILTLESSLKQLNDAQSDSIDYEVFRNATIKGFELSLETSAKLLRKALKTFVATPKTIDALTYKDVLRHAVKHSLLKSDAAERWFTYRDNRNDTAHDYGEHFAQTTLKLLPSFLKDIKGLKNTLDKHFEQMNAKS